MALLLATLQFAAAQATEPTVTGSLQSELGCAADFDPACPTTAMAPNANDGVWRLSATVPAGQGDYVVAVNGTLDEYYGAGGVRDGDAIGLDLVAERAVRFYFRPPPPMGVAAR